MAKNRLERDFQISRLIQPVLNPAPVGDGDLLGQPFRCLPYQRRFVRAGLPTWGYGGRGCLALPWTVARRGWPRALALDANAALVVTCTNQGDEVVLIASSFAQAKIAFEAVKTSLEADAARMGIPDPGSTKP